MVELAGRLLVYLTIVPLFLSTAAIARAGSEVDDPPETNPPAVVLPAVSIAQSFALIHPSPADPSSSTVAPGSAKRPATLLPLYISFTALQFADVHSTLSALQRRRPRRKSGVHRASIAGCDAGGQDGTGSRGDIRRRAIAEEEPQDSGCTDGRSQFCVCRCCRA